MLYFPVRWLLRNLTIRHGLVLSAISTLLIIFIVTFNLNNKTILPERIRTPPQVRVQCHSKASRKSAQISANHSSSSQLRLDPKVLLFVETQFSKLGRIILEILESSRIKFKIETSSRSLPILTNLDKGKFAIIIFENFEKYLNMNKWNRELLDKYCREYFVGIIGFVPLKEEKFRGNLKGFPLIIETNVEIRDYQLSEDSPILRLTKPGLVNPGPLPGSNWIVFSSNDSTYQPVAQSNIIDQNEIQTYNGSESKVLIKNEIVSNIIQDHGLHDGIRRVIFGNGFSVWIHKLILLDSISYLSNGILSLPLTRRILIDIDDIFVGEKGTRMRPSDVQALLEAQARLKSIIPGFRFNLGYSGKYYHKGNAEEDKGDDMLIENANEFWWFCHMWGHSQPHLSENTTILEAQMKLNKEFARAHKIPTDSRYSVAPHHSGVYPVHEPLYDAWKKVLNVKVTSTEEYPHLRPARLRRGFIHRGLMVMPRQTCGLYTHTIFVDKYPGGRRKLDTSIFGGELFYLFVYNPISIFMTHMSNYANDRLALYTFESVVRFVKCWTNIELETLPPVQLAIKYFRMHPGESDPIWMNPCKDKRHFSLWSSEKSCKQLPDFLIIGPQKTGSTALYTFLTMHPNIRSSYPSPNTFEEIQFFNGKNYYRGLDWYMNFYPLVNGTEKIYLFEKSATYFDGDNVPMRSHSLLPDAKIVAILINPIKRAYSWYQHVKYHRDVTALNYSFYEVITANEKSSKPLKDLKNRCLIPGCYAIHLERWLNYYSPRKLIIIDGEELRSDPVSVINRLQTFLEIEPFYDFKDRLRYDDRKGFFCQVTKKNDTKCLGKGKGRLYPEMDEQSVKILRTYYMTHNVALSKLLTRLHQALPNWLEEELSLS